MISFKKDLSGQIHVGFFLFDKIKMAEYSSSMHAFSFALWHHLFAWLMP